LTSARRRDRDLLRSRVTTAQGLRGDANQLAYRRAVAKFRRAYSVDRPTFYQNYKGAMSSAERASETIMKAAIDAGARDVPIIAYVIDDFASSVSAFMMTSFGHGPDAALKARRRDELLNLESNTSVQARALSQRLGVLRAEVERGDYTWFERIVFRTENNALGSLLRVCSRGLGWIVNALTSPWAAARKLAAGKAAVPQAAAPQAALPKVRSELPR